MRRPVAVALASSALLLAAAAPLLWTTLTGPSAEAVPPGQPSYDAYRYLESHYPRDVTEAVTVTVDGATPAGPARSLPAAGRSRRRGRPRHPVRPPPRATSPTPTSPSPSRRSATSSQDAVHAIRDLEPPAGSDRPRLGQHRPLHRPEAEPRRARAAGRRDHRPHHPRPALPAHRLGPAAAEDAADEHRSPWAPLSASSSSPSRRAGSTPRSTTPARRRSR